MNNQRLSLMAKIKNLFIVLICITYVSCGSSDREFPLNKRYWDTEDYHDVILELRFGYKDDEKKPTLDNPNETRIVQKLTDEQNFKVVLEDEELGIKHRNKIGSKFFDHWRDMMDIYKGRNRKDEYLYGEEMLAVWQFGLSLQLDYFKLGNDEIIEDADDPNSYSVKQNVNSNIQTLISNYTIYLDNVNDEKAFTEEGQAKLAKGIDIYFSELLKQNPTADYSKMKKKAELMLKKSESQEIKTSLEKLIALIDSKKKEAKEKETQN